MNVVGDIGQVLSEARWIWCHDQVMRCNQYALFRREVELPEQFTGVRLHICADLRYWLYVNGRRVGFGPARFHPTTPLFDTHDVRECLQPGKNTIAVKVHGIGPVNRCSSFMPRRCALIAAIEWDDGWVATDATWRAIEDPAYRTDTPRFANHQSYIESFDGRRALTGWELPGYDDSSWHPAYEIPADALAPWEELAPRPVPHLTLNPRLPVRVLETGQASPQAAADLDDFSTMHETLQNADRLPDTRIQIDAQELFPMPLHAPDHPRDAAYAVLDFGENSAGYLCFDVAGLPGTTIDFGYGEHMDYGRVMCAAQGVRYNDRLVLGTERLQHQILMPKTLRYLLIEVRHGAATFYGIRHDVSTSPVIWQGSFTAPQDPLLGNAWRLGAFTVQLCMEDVYMDTPRRERAGWLGDMLPQAMAAYHAFGETAVARHSLNLFLKSQRDDGAIIGRYPSNDGPNMPTFTASYSPALADYVRYSGDLDFIGELWPGIQRITGWFESFRRDDDLIKVEPTKLNLNQGYGYVLIDWAPIQLDGVVTGMCMFYVHYLRESAWLAEQLGEQAEADRLRELAGRTTAAIRNLLFDDQRGFFVNCYDQGRRSGRHGYHENLLALLWDIATPEQAASIDRTLLDREAPLPLMTWDGAREYQLLAGGAYPWPDDTPVPLGSPFFEYYALGALFESGRADAAMLNLRGHYGGLLAKGTTTVWEDWAGDSSRSHGWGAAPTTMLGKYILGVAPLEPGFRHFQVLPTFTDLQQASGRIPTPHGCLQVAWERQGKEVTLSVLVPPGCRATAGLPAPCSLQGEPCQLRRGTYQTVCLEPGRHRLSASLA